MRHDTAAVVRLALLLGAALPTGLAAQDAPAGRLYQVEVVIFAHPQGTSSERSPRGPAELIEVDGEPGLDAADDAVASPSPQARGYAPPRAPLALSNVAARLNTGGYRLLWHQAWVQPAGDTAPAELAALAALGQGRATQQLDGTISLSQGRFLHLGMELEWRSATGLEAELRERRRIRTGTDQYFDHPRIGAIAVVNTLRAD
jgi:hypothetical protein